MKKDENEVTGPNKDYIFGSDGEDEFDGFEEEDDGPCDVYNAVMGAIFISRPFGILWDEDLIEEFLVYKGYKIIPRTDEEGEIYYVPVKKESKLIPDSKSSMRQVFDREVQKSILKWLKKIK